MPSFTIGLSNLQQTGPILEIQIAIPRDLFNVLKQNNQPISNPIKAIALIDTGATSSVVNPDIIRALGISPTGRIKISTPSDTDVDCNQFKLAFVFPNNVIIESSDVIEAPLKGQPIQCLLGRDILRHAVFIYNGYMQQITYSV
jgi:predicted aspartyl protease